MGDMSDQVQAARRRAWLAEAESRRLRELLDPESDARKAFATRVGHEHHPVGAAYFTVGEASVHIVLDALRREIDPTECNPDVRHFKQPEGPCEDVATCDCCFAPGAVLRPPGETLGLHAENCSLPERHWGWCEPGGTGHPVGEVRGTDEPRRWRA